MRATIFALAALALACSAAPTSPAHATSDGGANATSPPLITFVDSPASTAPDDDDCYTIVVVISYTDDDEQVVGYRFDGDAGSYTGAMPSAYADGMTPVAWTLPRSAQPGTLTFELRLVSASGVESEPFSARVLLLL